MVTQRIHPTPVWSKGVKLPQFPKPDNFVPEPNFPEDWYNTKYAGKPRCQAWAVTAGSQCNVPPVKGRHHCRKHGGKSLLGHANPAFKTGKYSKVLPARMLSSYQASLRDPDLLDMNNDIALLNAHLEDVLSTVDTGEVGHLWRETKAGIKMLERAMLGRDASQTVVALAELKDKVNQGDSNYEAWKEVQRTLDARHRAIEKQQKRLVLMNQMMSVDRALLLVSRVADIIRRNVHDRDTLQRISEELAYLMDDPGVQGQEPTENRSEQSQGGATGSHARTA
jgi:hypothetical protein